LNPSEADEAAKRRTLPNSRPAGGADAQTAQQVITELGIVKWDLLLLGDGSGTGWKDACGWGVAAIDRLTREYSLFAGALNAGSINLAEMLPYLHALTWFHANQGRQRLKTRGDFMYVHIVTDSKLTVAMGREACSPGTPLPRVQQALWAAFREFTTLGYVITFHWQSRNTSVMNLVCDLVASLSRRSLLNTAQGIAPVGNRAQLLEAERAVTRLLKRGAGDAEATLQAAQAALQILLFADLSYAERLRVAISQVGLYDPHDGTPIDIREVDHDSISAG